MMCTWCGKSGHVAASCKLRSSAPMRSAAVVIAATLASLLIGCSGKPDVPEARLAPPPAELMLEPPALPPVPECEGNPRCRLAYYTRSRVLYGELAERHRGLQRWVKAGRPAAIRREAAQSPGQERG